MTWWTSFIGNPGWGIWIILGIFLLQMVVLGVFIIMAIAQGYMDGLRGGDDGRYKNE